MSAPVYASDLLRLAESKLGEERKIGWLRSLGSAGLLASPKIHGIPGERGGRRPGTWSAGDLALFDRVVSSMARGQSRRQLCNIIASAWLEAEPPRIAISQLRKALRTYRDGVSSHRSTRRVGLELAELFAGGPGMSRPARRRFLDAFERALHDGDINPPMLDSAIFDPEGIGPPPVQSAIGPKGLVVFLEAWKAGCEGLDEFDETTFGRARLLFERISHRCVEIMPRLSQSPRVGFAFAAGARERLQADACAYVLLALGLVALSQRAAIKGDGVG